MKVDALVEISKYNKIVSHVTSGTSLLHVHKGMASTIIKKNKENHLSLVLASSTWVC